MLQTAPQIPEVRIIEELGRGAHSVVYRADYGGRVCAVKAPSEWLGSDTDSTLSFYREAAFLACLRRFGFPAVHRVGEVAGRPYLIRELIDGEPLDRVLRERGALDQDSLVAVGTSLARALQAMHERGLVHRDVKPQNILVMDGGHSKLIDFGFATEVGISRADAVVGTFGYAAPEQTGMLKLPVDGRADLYALGVVLFECAAGKAPFSSNDVAELMRQHAVRPPADLNVMRPDLEPTLVAVINKLLAKDPDDRYQSAAGLAADLNNLSALSGGSSCLDADAAGFIGRERIPGVVGRERELAALRRLSRARNATYALVEGPGGIGKTSLIEALCHDLRGRGMLVMRGTCSAANPRPFLPIREVLDGLAARVSRVEPDRREKLLERVREAAGTSAPWLQHLSPKLALATGYARADDQDIHASSEDYCDTIADFLVRIASPDGAVLVVDDVQWLDPASRRVLCRLAEQGEHGRLFLLCTARTEEATRDACGRFIADMQGVDLERIDLEVLGEAQVAELLQALLGNLHIDPAFMKDIAVRSNGNPLAVCQLIRAMLDAGLLRPSLDRWIVDDVGLERLELPGDVVRLFLRRIDQLGPESRQLLQLAAVLGSSFALSDLERCIETAPTAVYEALSRGIQARILVRLAGGDYGFVHERAREALLAELADDDERAMHQRIAEALDPVLAAGDAAPEAETERVGDGGEPSEGDAETVYTLAHHYARGYPERRPERAYQTHRRAGFLAFSSHAMEDAHRFLERAGAYAADFAIEPDPAFDETLGICATRLGHSEQALAHLKAALGKVDDPIWRARLYAHRARVYLGGIDTANAKEELGHAFAEIRAPLRRWMVIRVLVTFAAALMGLAVHLFKLGFGTARGRRRERYRVLVQLYQLMAHCGWYECDNALCVHMGFRQLYPAYRLGPSRELVEAYCTFAMFWILARVRPLAYRYIESAHQVARGLGDLPLLGYSYFMEVVLREFAGTPLRAIALNRRLLGEYGARLDAESHILACCDMVWNLLMRGYFREALTWADRAVALDERNASSLDTPHSILAYQAPLQAIMGQERKGAATLKRFREAVARENAGGRVSNRFRTAELHSLSMLFHLATGKYGDNSAAVAADASGHARLALRPRFANLHHRHFYVFHAYVRLAACQRGRWDVRLDTDSEAEAGQRKKAMKALKGALRALAKVADQPMIGGHYHVVAASYDHLCGRAKFARNHLARAERIAEKLDNHWVTLEVAYLRARISRDLDRLAVAKRSASIAADLAAAQGWQSRARRIRAEFALAEGSHSMSRRSGRVSVERSTLRVQRQLEALLQLSHAAANVVDPDVYARVALDEILRIIGAERAFLFVWDGHTLKLAEERTSEGVDREQSERDEGDSAYSASVVESVCERREAIILTGSESGALTSPSASVMTHGLRSIVATPLLHQDELRGVLYLDSRLARGVFDEEDLGLLSALGNHIAVAMNTARAARIEVERTALEKDLAVTAAVQSMFLPTASSMTRSGLTLIGHYEPAARCGGDWWWYEFLDDGRLRVLLGDVTGHGAGAAMVTAAVASSYRTLSGHRQGGDLSEIIDALHATMLELWRYQYRMTLLGLELAPGGEQLRWWNSGAPPVLVQGPDGAVEVVAACGAPLGGEGFRCQSGVIAPAPGSRILAFTDGVPETRMGSSMREFGYRRLARLLEGTRGDHGDVLCEELIAALAEARAGREAEDDVTFVLVDAS